MLIVSPLKMQWEAKYKEIFPQAKWSNVPLEGHDSYLFMWCDNVTKTFINSKEKRGRYVVFVRRYEYYSELEKLDWNKVDEVIMVNDWLAGGFEQRTGIKPHVIYNGVDPSKWTFKVRTDGNKMAWVGFINQRKNLPLAIQILAELHDDYELHIAGEVQDFQVWDYIQNIVPKTKRKVIFNGYIPHEYMDRWLEDKNYILNTSISEGCPNSVLEAMAKGIKPVVHAWPGCIQQFGNYTFNTVGQAISIVQSHYASMEYREKVVEKFGINQFQKVKDIVCGV